MAGRVDAGFIRFALLVLVLLLAGSLCGCSGQEQAQQKNDEPAAAPEEQALTVAQVAQVEKAVAIAKAIEAAPATAAAVLEKYAMSAEDFENLMYEISADGRMTAAYEAAFH